MRNIIIALLLLIGLLFAVPAMSAEGTDTCADLGYTKYEGDASGDWGSAKFTPEDPNGLVLTVNEGYEVDVCTKKGSEQSSHGGAKEAGTFPEGEWTIYHEGSEGEGFSHYGIKVTDEPEEPEETNYCDPSQKPGGMSIGEWLESAPADADTTCVSIETSPKCGSFDANVTENETPYEYDVLYAEGNTIPDDTDAWLPLPVAFDEDSGDQTITYFIVGPEQDYVAHLPAAFVKDGVTTTVNTDCNPPTCEDEGTCDDSCPHRDDCEESTTEVAGESTEAEPTEEVTAPGVEVDAEVETEVEAAADELPRTGGFAYLLVAAGIALLGGGTLILRRT